MNWTEDVNIWLIAYCVLLFLSEMALTDNVTNLDHNPEIEEPLLWFRYFADSRKIEVVNIN